MKAFRLACVALAATVVAGCSSAEPATDSGAAKPVEEVMAQALDRGDDNRDETLAYWDQVNSALVGCMKAEGYDYQPFIDQWAVDRRIALGLSREQFVRQYGYGLTTLIDYLPPGTRRVDPNRRALAGMTSEQVGGWRGRLERCRREAEERFGPAPNVANLRLSPEQSARSDRIYGAVDADPRVVRAGEVRRTCLEEKGFDSGDARSLRLAKAAEKFRDGFERAVAEADEAGRDSAALRLSDVFSGTELGELKRLQEREIAEARQTEPCQWPYDDLYKQVYREYLDKALAGEL
ncbi:hypothetical protein ACFOOK_08425 [Micromonospora krabiensis]|uniref:Lipoprotein n=1 Tax=Micromonospora krabiensis TaxID=307121 RepID=A0A1C3NBK6_9ACTN|nr:hypothetical protein [Micromonospora krabiensis]SBV29977.1 hypothetical protein GA0070620_5564 [Micromonospora krabiensis]